LLSFHYDTWALRHYIIKWPIDNQLIPTLTYWLRFHCWHDTISILSRHSRELP